jgi:hypothetical protein
LPGNLKFGSSVPDIASLPRSTVAAVAVAVAPGLRTETVPGRAAAVEDPS